MSGKQHVGAQSDALVADDDLDAARAAQRAALEAIRPKARQRIYKIGDGDQCPFPINDSCGAMFVLSTEAGPKRQFCPNQAHDSASRAVWSLNQFEADVKAYTPVPATSLASIDLSAMEDI